MLAGNQYWRWKYFLISTILTIDDDLSSWLLSIIVEYFDSIIDSFNVTNSIVKSKMMESDKKRSLSASIMVASKSHDIFTTHNGYW